MNSGIIILALDYDGVLVDSYRGVADFYRRDLRELMGVSKEEADFLLYLEYLSEGIGLMREDWWFKFIPGLTEERFDELISRYWERRIEKTMVLPGVVEALKLARNKNMLIAHVGYRDDIYGLKRERLEYDGLAGFFDEIIVVGEDAPTRHDAIRLLIEKYRPTRIVYVDDKAQNLYVMSKRLPPSVELFKISFSSFWDFPWKTPAGLFMEFRNLSEVVRFILGDIK